MMPSSSHAAALRELPVRPTEPKAAAARSSRLGPRSISMELRGPGGRGVTWRDGGDDIGGSKARGGTYAANKAIALEAELNALDGQVMQHLRQPGDSQTPGDFNQQASPRSVL